MPGGMAGGRAQRPMHLSEVECTLEELYRGGNKTVKHRGKPFQLPIQPGWKAGTKIKFEDDGVAFSIKEAEHETFTRQGNDLHCTVFPSSPWSLFTGDTQQVATLDGRRVTANFASMAFTCVVQREGMPFRSKDATGQLSTGKGNLVVHLLCNWGNLLQQAQGWGRILIYILGFWLVLNNPSIAIMLVMGYNAMQRAA